MQDDITQPTSIHCLRSEVRAVRAVRAAHTSAGPSPVFIEDIIIGRLIETEVNLAVAAGLFKELAEDMTSPYLKYGPKLSEALDIVQDALNLRNPGLYP